MHWLSPNGQRGLGNDCSCRCSSDVQHHVGRGYDCRTLYCRIFRGLCTTQALINLQACCERSYSDCPVMRPLSGAKLTQQAVSGFPLPVCPECSSDCEWCRCAVHRARTRCLRSSYGRPSAGCSIHLEKPSQLKPAAGGELPSSVSCTACCSSRSGGPCREDRRISGCLGQV